MTAADRTWLVLLRDVSHAVRIPDEPRIVASLVFDMGTGLVLATRVAATEEKVLTEVCEMAIKAPAGGLAPRHPDRVLCGPGLRASLASVLGGLSRGSGLPEIEEVGCIHEAEDVFDFFVGHLAGRQNPEHFPEPADWRLLFDQVLAYYERQPWTRWADDVDLLLEMKVGAHRTSFVAIVLGNANLEYGLVLYPGKVAPAGLRDPKPTRAVPMPPGTLMLSFDEPDAVPPEFVGRARRYGWPQSAKLVPVILSVEKRRPGEPSQDEVRALTVALAAVLEHDGRGPVLVDGTTHVSEGTLISADGRQMGYAIRQLARPEEAEQAVQLRVHLAATELIPPDTTIVMGAVSSSALVSLRRDARVHRPRPAGSPVAEVGELPLIVVVTNDRHGDALTAAVATMDPLGVTVADDCGVSAVVLVGTGAAQMLMELPTGDPALRKFRSRLKASRGVHAVLIADEASAVGEGTVYGVFEFHLPSRPSPPRTPVGQGSVRHRRKRR